MVHALTATLVSLEEDEENLVFAFSADEAGAGQYVMFQHALSQEGKGIPPGRRASTSNATTNREAATRASNRSGGSTITSRFA